MQPQAKKHVTMDCDGGRRGRWREKGRSDRGLSIIGNQARYHLDREEVLIVLLINKQRRKLAKDKMSSEHWRNEKFFTFTLEQH